MPEGYGKSLFMSDSRMMVMVASLERHLSEERKILTEAIAGQNSIPVGLAYPPIPANYIYKLNQQALNDADYVVLLIGSEYGALTDKGVGYVHATFAAAQAARKPILSLIYEGEATQPTDNFDEKRLKGFVDQLKTGCVFYWHDDDSLRDSAERGLEFIFEHHPSTGWIKADLQPLVSSVSADDQSLIQKLKTQVQHLTQKVQSLPGHSKAEKVDFSKDQRLLTLKYQCNAFREGRLKQLDGQLGLPLKTLFDWLAPTLLSPVTEARLRAVIAIRIQEAVLAEAKSRWPGSHAVSDIKVQQSSFDELKIRLRALNAVAFDDHGRWFLTPSGEHTALALSESH